MASALTTGSSSFVDLRMSPVCVISVRRILMNLKAVYARIRRSDDVTEPLNMLALGPGPKFLSAFSRCSCELLKSPM